MTSLDGFKLQAVTWDTDKDPSPAAFQRWSEDLSAVVRATKHGGPLEDLIDDKIGQKIIQPIAVPSFIKDDPDFAHFMQVREQAGSQQTPLQTRITARLAVEEGSISVDPDAPSESRTYASDALSQAPSAAILSLVGNFKLVVLENR